MSNDPHDAQEPERIPPLQNTPPPAYDQPANQFPQYAHPAINTPGQPSYNANNINPYEQIPYTYQQSRYQNPFPPSNPLPLGTAIRQLPAQYWRVLTQPRAATFDAEQGKAAWNIIWVQLFAITIIHTIISIIGALIALSLSVTLGKGILSSAVITFSKNPPQAILLSLISLPIGFFIVGGFYLLMGKAFGGRGTFLRFGYCLLLITAPINIINSILDLIPTLGSVTTYAFGIYTIVLIIFATMAVHHLSGGKATMAVISSIFLVIFTLVIVVGLLYIFTTNLGWFF